MAARAARARNKLAVGTVWEHVMTGKRVTILGNYYTTAMPRRLVVVTDCGLIAASDMLSGWKRVIRDSNH